MLKRTFQCALILLACFFIVQSIHAAETFDRPLIEGGGNSQDSTTKLSEDAESSRETTTKNVLEKIFDLFYNADDNRRIIPIPPTQTAAQLTPPPNSGNDDNLLPTDVYPSITYYPQTDSTDILNDPGLTYSTILMADVQACLQNRNVYETAERHNSIPWVVLAGIHNTEGNCNSNQSVISGRQIGDWEPDLNGQCSTQDTGIGKPKVIGYTVVNGKNVTKCAFDNLLDSAVYAGVVLKRKTPNGNGAPKTHQELVYALAGYNGWGNINCGRPPTYRTRVKAYTACPALYDGEDHVAAWNLMPDDRHNRMYKVFCRDGQTCEELGMEPQLSLNMGSLTSARIIKKLTL